MANKFREKQIEAEVLGELYNVLATKERDIHQDYRVIGTSDEQDTHWKTGELLWEDDEKTIPRMKQIWGYVDKEELSEDEEIRVAVYKRLMAALEKML